MGFSVVIKKPIKIPIKKNRNNKKLNLDFFFKIKRIDIDEKITKPKNSEKTWIGKFSYALKINETNKKIEEKIPPNKVNKNCKL